MRLPERHPENDKPFEVVKINQSRLTKSPEKPQKHVENQWLRKQLSVKTGLRKSAMNGA